MSVQSQFKNRFVDPFRKKQFWIDLYREIDEDQVSNGAAALAYYFMLAVFPAMIFMLSVLPYLHIPDLSIEIMSMIAQALPVEAAKVLEDPIVQITTAKKQGLVSFGAIFTLWSASAGLYAIMQQLDITYDVRETRPFWKVRGLSILLSFGWGALVISSFALIVAGGFIQSYLADEFYLSPLIPVVFFIFRWAMVLTLLFGAFALIYYFGTNVTQKFRFITPGAVIGVAGLIGASLLFRLYVSHFANYDASYGSIGAVIVLMLWFYIAGHMILIGSEINALIEAGPTKLESLRANHEFARSLQPEKPAPSERPSAQTPSKNPEHPAGGVPAGAAT